MKCPAYAKTGFVTAKKASKKLLEEVAVRDRPGTGFAPAPIIAMKPARVMTAALRRPIHAKRSSVRGSEMKKAMAPVIITRYMLHMP
jgi:hypothetical protein